MKMALTIGKGLLKFTWSLFKIFLFVVSAWFESETRRNPVCSEMEAYGRRERGTISDDEFYTAINQK